MSNEKKTELEQLQEELAAAKQANEELQAVNSELNEKVSEQDAASAAKAAVITHKKNKYIVRAAACRIRVDRELKLIEVVDASGKKVASAADLDAILKIEGQKILETV